VAELPTLKALVERHPPQDLAVVGVNLDEDPDEYSAGRERHGLPWRDAFQGGLEGPLTSLWGVRALPAVFVIDRGGRIHARDLRREEIAREVETLLQGER